MHRIAKLLLALLLICFFVTPAFANCDIYWVKYNTGTTIDFCLWKTDATAFKTDATFAAGDVKINLAEAGENNIGTLPTDRGNCYSVPLSTSETSTARAYIYFTKSGTFLDKCILLYTYGNASATYPFDLSVATQPVNVTQYNSSNVGAPDSSGYPKVTIKDGTGTGEVDTTSGKVSIAAGGLGADAFATTGTISAKSGTLLTISNSVVTSDNQFTNGWFITVMNPSTGLIKAGSCISATDENGASDTITTADDISAIISVSDAFDIKPQSACNGFTLANGSITAAKFAAGAIDATAFAQAAADKVWSTTTRQLTSTQAFNNTGTWTGGVTGSVGSVATGGITTASFAAGAVNAAALGTDVKGATYSGSTDTLENIRDRLDAGMALSSSAIDAAQLTTAAANKLADHVWRRNSTNIEASSDGDTLAFQSPYGVVAQQTNNTTVSGSTLTVKKANGVTTFASRTVTTSAGASPITGIATN